MDDLLEEIKREFGRVKSRNNRLSDVIKNINYVAHDDGMSDEQKIKFIIELTDEFIARFQE